MIHLLQGKASPEQVSSMLEQYHTMIKIAVDIRPRLGNRGMVIQDERIRQSVESVTKQILGGVQ